MESCFQGDSRKSYSLSELAEILGTTVRGDPAIRVRGVNSLEEALPDELSFITDVRYKPLLSKCRAAAIIVSPALADLDFPLLVAERPYVVFARAAQLFAEPPFLAPGVHPGAYIGPNVHLGEGVSVGPQAHIGEDCVIGPGTRIHGSAHLGSGVRVGENCMIYPGAVILDRCLLGNRVTVHSGTVVGSDGFGYAQDEKGRHVKIPQTGIVQIDDDVEIGANCTVDRATFGRTWIRMGAKIDNQVQIAHNVVIGEHAILVAQVGISGSTTLGSHVVLAGQVGVAGHIEIGDRARVGAKSGVHHSVGAGEDILGIPGVPAREWKRTYANIQRLARFREELRLLVEKVQRIEKALDGE